MKKTTTIHAQVSNDSALRDGLAKNHKASEKLVIAGEEMSCGEPVKLLDERIIKARKADEARRDFRDRVAEYHANVDETALKVSSLRAQLISRLGPTAGALGDHGIAPRKTRSAPTVEERAFIVAKAKATRDARHTVGKNARREIHGEQPLQIVFGDAPSPSPQPTPAPPPVASAPVAQPAVAQAPIKVVTNGGLNGALNGASTNGALNGATPQDLGEEAE